MICSGLSSQEGPTRTCARTRQTHACAHRTRHIRACARTHTHHHHTTPSTHTPHDTKHTHTLTKHTHQLHARRPLPPHATHTHTHSMPVDSGGNICTVCVQSGVILLLPSARKSVAAFVSQSRSKITTHRQFDETFSHNLL